MFIVLNFNEKSANTFIIIAKILTGRHRYIDTHQDMNFVSLYWICHNIKIGYHSDISLLKSNFQYRALCQYIHGMAIYQGYSA